MADKARLFDFRDQTPVVQLFTVISLTILTGTLSFYIFAAAGSLIFGAGISEMLSLPALTGGSRELSIFRYIQVSQQIGLFILPAFLIAFLFRTGAGPFLKINEYPLSQKVLLVILLAFLLLPVTVYTGMINSRMSLPEWLSGVEGWMRTKEDSANNLTALLIKSDSINVLLLNLGILAVVPSIAEELMFRGILQQIFCKVFRSSSAGIWVTAVLFSAIHLQFYGFLPRLILGLSFGYLFYWTGNLWIPIIAHFINNAVPVIIAHFTGLNQFANRGSEVIEKQVILTLISLILSIIIFYYFRADYRKVKNSGINNTGL